MNAGTESKGRLQELRVLNFKSFNNKHRIGPFLNFTAVIGPNGGGKSNIMDAVSFVLGVRSSDLRASNLKELIYRNESEKITDLSRDAYVKLIFFTAEDQKLVFKRTISASGQSDYFINGKRENLEIYTQVLQDLNIIVKAKNFLIFQGQVDSLAMKSGRELTMLFERISGADDYKSEYDGSKGSVEVCEENLKTINAKISFLLGEKKKLKEQKTHAGNYERIVEKIKELQCSYYLLQFAGIEREIDKKRETVEAKRIELDTLRRNKEKCIVQLRECNVNLKQTEQKLINITDDFSSKSSLILTKKPEISKLKENIKQFETRITAKNEHLEKIQLELGKEERKLHQLTADQQAIESEIEVKKKHLEEEMTIAISQNKKSSYLQIKQQFGIRTFAEKKELERLMKELTTKEVHISLMQQQLKDKVEDKSKLEEEISGLKAFIDKKNLDKAAADEAKVQAIRNLTVVTQEQEKLKSKESELLKTLESLDTKIREFKVSEACVSANEKERTVIEDMIRHRKGVKGLFSDLVTAIQPKYNTAIEASLKSVLNYLIVDTIETATYVNQKLKDHSIIKDVVVLENIPETHTSETLRQSVSKFGSLLIDIVTFEKDYGLEKAVNLFVGNKALADTLENANRLRSIKGVKMIVTIDGVCIKNGMIASPPFRRKVEKTSQKRVLAEREAEEFRTELGKIQQVLRGENTVATIRQNIENYTGLLGSLDKEILIKTKYMEGVVQKGREVRDAVGTMQQQLRMLEGQAEQIRNKVAEVKNTIGSLETSMFGEFCEEMGIESIKVLEGRDIHEEDRLRQQIHSLEKEQSKLTWAVKALNLVSLNENKGRLIETIEKDSRELEKVRARSQQLINDYDKLTEITNMLREQEKYLKSQVAKQRELQENLQKSYDIEIKACSRVEKDFSNEERDMEHLKQQKDQKIEELLVKNLELPMIQQGNAKEIDFSKLDPQYMRMNLQEIETELEKISSDIEKESKSLESLLAQGKCTFQQDKFKDLEDKLEDANKQLEYFDRLSKDAKANFLQIKEKRRSCFMNTFDHVANNIGRIYKEMTKTEKNTYYGGNALLYVDNTEEPYNGGVIYSPTPPGKRCMYEMDQLSGGEKTIAALSLLFAIHSAMPSPFYIMDEVDAFLDWENCQLLLNYLQKISEERSQCIIITHKEEFFSNADGLIGTTFVPSESTSRSFSFDLRPYGPKQIAMV